MEPGRPAADECLPDYFQYIDLVPDEHIVALLERQITETAAYLAAFTPEQASRREAPGEWNVLEIVGHVVDVERVSGYRALRIARADPVMWTQVECGRRRLRCCADLMPPRGSGARRRTGRCAACAPSRTTSRATSDITWPTSAGNTAGSTARVWQRRSSALENVDPSSRLVMVHTAVRENGLRRLVSADYVKFRGGRDALGPVFPLFAPCDCRGHLQPGYARAERHLRQPDVGPVQGGIP